MNYLFSCSTELRTVKSCMSPLGQIIYIFTLTAANEDRDSVVNISTRYGLDGLGIESQWGVRFFATVHTGPGTHSASCTGIFLRGKTAGASSSAKVKEKIELYLYSRLGFHGLVWGEYLRISVGF
jgi:hypothetical protein